MFETRYIIIILIIIFDNRREIEFGGNCNRISGSSEARIKIASEYVCFRFFLGIVSVIWVGAVIFARRGTPR